MSIKKRVVLSVSVFMAMLVALVTGIICLNKPNASSPAPSAPTDSGSVQKPTSYTFKAGQVQLAGTNIDTIDFKYDPSVDATEEEPTQTVRAYEYIFGRPESVEETMAVTVKPIVEVEGIDVCYVYSDKEIDFDSEEITAKTKFEAQTIDIKGADIYIYLLVVATDVTEPVDFTTNIVWNFGNKGTMIYHINDKIITETIVKGQDLPEPEIPTAPTGYYFDAWFTDEQCTKPATFPLRTQGQQLYARYWNFPEKYLNLVDDHYEIIKVTETLSGDITIPNYYNGKPVTKIVDSDVEASFGGDFSTCVFGEQTGITSINLPSTMTYIGVCAFVYCTGLTNIVLPDSIDTINIGAFAFCLGLQTIKLPKNLTAMLPMIFAECTSLTYVDASYTNITTITGDESAGAPGPFVCSVSQLQSINLTGCTQLTSLEFNAFISCDKLTSVDLSKCTSLTSIGEEVFYQCSGLTSVSLPSSLTSIGDQAFQDCSSLSNITLPSGVTSIGNSAFSGCSSLTSIDLSKCTSLTSIGEEVFYQCSGLTSISLPSSLTSIGDEAFAYCTSLTSVDLSECTSLTSIGDKAFYECDGLTSIDLRGCTSLTSTGNCAFEHCSWLTSVTLPSSITNIGDTAFSLCELTSIDLSGCTGLTSIGDDAFSYCELTSIDLSGCTGLTSIGNEAFERCIRLTSITLPSSLTSIGSSAFQYCSRLTSIDLSKCTSLTSIGDTAFSYCELTSIDLSGCTGLTSIGDEAFEYCRRLTSVTLPSSLTSIGDEAFFCCSGLTSIVIPASVTKIGYRAFRNSGLTSVTFNDTSTWYAVSTEAEWNNCNTTNATEITGLTTSANSANATALKISYVDKYWFRVD